MVPFAPHLDTTIEQRYSAKALEQKMANKLALQEQLGWPQEKKCPILCIPAGMTDKLGGSLFQKVLPGILSMNAELLVLGRGSQNFGALFTKLAKEESHRVHIVAERDADIRKMYAASDIALYFSDPAGLPELTHCLNYGTVPVAPMSESLEDYDPVQEHGTAFLAESPTPWLWFAALVRALETYKFPFDWRTIQKQCMERSEMQ